MWAVAAAGHRRTAERDRTGSSPGAEVAVAESLGMLTSPDLEETAATASSSSSLAWLCDTLDKTGSLYGRRPRIIP